MSTPTSDSPDFQAVTQQHTAVIVNEQNVSLPAGYSTLYGGPSSSWASFQVRCFLTSGHGQLTILWFTDAALTLGVGSDTFLVNASTHLNMFYPVQAQYCKVLFNNTTTTTADAYIYFAGTQVPVDRVRYLITDQTIYAYNETISGGGSYNGYTGFIQSGQGTLTVKPHDTNGNVDYYVYATDETQSIVATLGFIIGPTGPEQTTFSVPDQPIQLHAVNNNGTNARTADLALVIQSLG